jgi:hypothetical protein
LATIGALYEAATTCPGVKHSRDELLSARPEVPGVRHGQGVRPDRLIGESRKPEAERFKNWLYRDVLPRIRKYVYYASPGVKTGPTTDEMKEVLRAFLRDELPAAIAPIVLKTVRARTDHADQAELVRLLTGAVERLADLAVTGREQNELARQKVQLITPRHQMFAPAGDYIEMDGVAAALKIAPRLAELSFGLDCCPDHGKASLRMKKLCRAENNRVIKNAVERIIAKDAGLEEPPLYIPEFRMKRLDREHVKALMYNAACWAKVEQTFLPADTPTLLFPGPRTDVAPDAGKTEEA